MKQDYPVHDNMDKPFPLWIMLLIPVYAFLALAVVVFPVAGDWRWISGWVFVVTIAINITLSNMVINKKNPRVLRNRSKLKKTGLTKNTRQAASSDRFIFPLMAIGFFGAMVVAALGHRLGWYSLVFPITLVGVVLVNLGVIIMHVAMLQNSYASKLLDINQEQALVDSGLYGYVRHPLYAGAILMAFFIPVALGSLWGLLPALISVLMLVIRIEYEEEMLFKGMAGYEDYQKRVKYKLIPGFY